MLVSTLYSKNSAERKGKSRKYGEKTVFNLSGSYAEDKLAEKETKESFIETFRSAAERQLIITDPKTFATASKWSDEGGIKISAYNFNSPEGSLRYDPLRDISEDDDFQEFAEKIILADNTRIGITNPDKAMDQMKTILISTAVGYVCRYMPEEKRTMSQVIKLISNAADPDIADRFSETDEFLKKRHTYFYKMSQGTVQSIIAYCIITLQVFRHGIVTKDPLHDTLLPPSDSRLIFLVADRRDQDADMLKTFLEEDLRKYYLAEVPGIDNNGE